MRCSAGAACWTTTSPRWHASSVRCCPPCRAARASSTRRRSGACPAWRTSRPTSRASTRSSASRARWPGNSHRAAFASTRSAPAGSAPTPRCDRSPPWPRRGDDASEEARDPGAPGRARDPRAGRHRGRLPLPRERRRPLAHRPIPLGEPRRGDALTATLSLAGKTALVTGAATGIGRATARCSRRGCAGHGEPPRPGRSGSRGRLAHPNGGGQARRSRPT